MDITLIVFFSGVLIFLAHLFASIFEKTKIPDVLPLVLIGVLIGPIGGIVDTVAIGKVGSVLAAVSLVVILFQGGLGLEWSQLRDSAVAGSRLTIINFCATLGIVALLGHYAMGMPLLSALMFGAILGGTSSAVVIPIIDRLHIGRRAHTSLFLESTLSDVLVIMVALALLKAMSLDSLNPTLMLGQVVASFVLATLIGGGAGLFWSGMMYRVRRLENSIFTTPAFVAVVAGATELLGYSGAIAALAFGIALGNVPSLPKNIIRENHFFSINDVEKKLFQEAVFLLKTFFFVYIGISMRLTDASVILAGFGITIAIYLIRVPVVRAALPKDMTRTDATIASIMVPKGLAAAVMASMPVDEGFVKGELLQDTVYAVVLISITLTAFLVYLAESGRLQGPYAAVLGSFSRKAKATDVRPSH